MTTAADSKTESRAFEADVAKLLHMMVHSVYSDRDNMYNAISEHIRGGGSLFGERPFYRPDLKLSNDQ